jgi:diguanylate cyclase (GGDEF)-like protein
VSRTESYLEQHRRSIEELASSFSRDERSTADRQGTLTSTHRIYPSFVTMLATDRMGHIIASAPQGRMASVVEVDYTVADRDYFLEAMDNPGVYVSSVFRGRGFGTEPIVAISAAYRNAAGEPLGVVEGSLDLNLFADVAEVNIRGNPIEVLLVDSGDRVIHASASLGFEALQQLDKYIRFGPAPSILDLVEPGDARHNGRYLYARQSLANGWQMYALINYTSITGVINDQYSAIFLVLLAAIAMAAALTWSSGARLVAPLESLADQLARVSDQPVGLAPLPGELSVEVALVYSELQRSMALIAGHQRELEHEVTERTAELRVANERLQALAAVDSLTGLLNRRSMEERFAFLNAIAARDGANLAVVLVDIDHFKKLNDRHGHIAGDRCLVEMAGAMRQEFARESDIVARFGGEEFVVIARSIPLDRLQSKLEHLRVRIAALRIVTDNGVNLQMTASFGALLGDARSSARIEDWLAAADVCLYRAKNEGRNRIVIETRDTTMAT